MSSTSSQISPFAINVPQAQLDDLRRRLALTRWPAPAPEPGWARGVPIEYLQDLVKYWAEEFNWRQYEALLNAFPQFTTYVDGQNVHFLHVKSPEPDALPLIMTHGWPGSVVEFTKVIGPLTDPRSHGGDPADAFHVVAPSLPGFGFSSPPTQPGWDTTRIAVAWAELMRRLGYERYGAQGGDTGSIVSPKLGRTDPEHVVGIHVNGLTVFPSGDPAELAGLSEDDKQRLARLREHSQERVGYAQIQSTRPQTLGYGLADSPSGQLAWIVEKFKEWTDPAAALPEDAVDRDQMLANVTLYWLTNSGGSSAQLYYEGRRGWGKPAERSPVPVGVAVFPGDNSIRPLAERENTVIHWSEFHQGGHFAAMEVPELLVADTRAFFRLVR